MTAREARRHFSPLAIRFFMLGAHYRSPLNFSEEALKQATAAVERLQSSWRELSEARKSRPEGQPQEELRQALAAARRRFCEALDDDFNTAGALGALFEAVKAVNSALKDNREGDLDALQQAEELYRLADAILGVFGLDRPEDPAAAEDAAQIDALVERRLLARKNKDFAEADRIRHELGSRGIVLEDTPGGTRWHRAL